MMDHRPAVACESSINCVKRKLYAIDEARGWYMAEVLERGSWCGKGAQTPWQRLEVVCGRADSCRHQKAVGLTTKGTVLGSPSRCKTCKLFKFRLIASVTSNTMHAVVWEALGTP